MKKAAEYTDAELIRAFSSEASGKLYEADYIDTPRGVDYKFDQLEKKYLVAGSKPEALRIAREYGERILGKRLVYLYYVPKGPPYPLV
jgi:hypothetical protein